MVHQYVSLNFVNLDLGGQLTEFEVPAYSNNM